MTKAPNPKLSPERIKQVERALPMMFFFQAFIALATVPRVPELIKQLNLDPAGWGLVVGIAGATGMLAMMFGSRIIRRFATRRVMLISATIYSLCVASYGFLNSGVTYFFFAALFTVNMSMFNLALNTNAVTFQKIVKRVILGKFHASWSIGATVTTFVGGILATFTTLQTHLLIVSALSLAMFWYFGRQVLSAQEDRHAENKGSVNKVPFFKSPRLLWLLAAGNITGVMCEAMLIDWSSVFTQDFMKLPLAIATLPYTIFGLAMIVGRLSISRLAKRHHFSDLARVGGIFGSLALMAGIWIGPAVASVSPFWGMVVTSAFWAIAGLGVAPMMPSFASASGNVPNLDTTQAMARMTLITSITMMGAKIFMGNLVHAFDMQVAFIFVGVSFFTAAMIAGVVAKNLKQNEIAPNAFPATAPISTLDA